MHCVEDFVITGLISFAIVFATLRAYFGKFLAFMQAAGFSPLFILSLLTISIIYACIATIRCCAWCQHQVGTDEESVIMEEDLLPYPKSKSPVFRDWRWDGQHMRLYNEESQGAIKLVDEPSGNSLSPQPVSRHSYITLAETLLRGRCHG